MSECCFRLIHNRELTLFDGTRLMGKERYDRAKQESGQSDEQLREKSVWN